MSSFVYIIAEGVLDVVVLSQVLTKGYGFNVIEKKSSLPEPAKLWLDQYKWPNGDDITRRAVPAPVILHKDGTIIGLRNAQGLNAIENKITEDRQVFLRIPWHPSVIGVILDADDAPIASRFNEFSEMLGRNGYPTPLNIGIVECLDNIRSAIFSFPGHGQQGTLEDALLPLANTRFPDLFQHASTYVRNWTDYVRNWTETHPTSRDFREFRKPSGEKKAILSAMAAILKPAKPLNSTIEDHNWVPNNLESCSALDPLKIFLDQLLNTEDLAEISSS
jgi:hypothetical protein